jgi:hypothetical protein
MDEFLIRTFHQLLERPAGPFRFRFVLQPLAAAVIAVRAGLRDAGLNRDSFLRSFRAEPSKRSALIHDAWTDIAKVFIIAAVLDGIYQVVMFRWFYPLQTLIVAGVLSIVPYFLIRVPVMHLLHDYLPRRKD